jgi:tetratricopeptide (TPR) repeat protein
MAALLAAAVLTAGGRPARAEGFSEDGLFGTSAEMAGWLAVREDKLVRAREIGESILRDHPESYAGHYIVGYAQHYGETNLPRALFHLRRARQLFEAEFGPRPQTTPLKRPAPWRWHQEILLSLAWVTGELDLHEERLSFLQAHDDAGYQPKRLAERGWPLMKLGKLAEARRHAKEAMLTGDPWQRKVAATALCGIEFESGDREAAYRACSAAVELVKRSRSHGTTEYSNGGVASMAVLKFDEAERRFTEATHRPPADYANPWRRLLSLYTREGRLPEAVAAAKQVPPYRLKRPPHVDQHDQAETESTLASLLLVAGYWQEALRIADRALERPDRQGGSSTSVAQAVAGAAILARAARLEAAERLAEAAAVAPFWESLKLRAQAAEARLRTWAAGRQAATLLADPKRLVATLRPHSSGGAEGPEWLLADIVRIVGPGVAARAVEMARAQETMSGALAYIDAIDADVQLLRGHHAEALKLAERAMTTLPSAEGLLVARAAAVGAQAAWELGDLPKSLGLYQKALSRHPGVLRQLQMRLPVRFAARGEIAQRVADYLGGSPRLRVSSRGGLTLSISGDAQGGRGCLLGPDGSQLSCADVEIKGPTSGGATGSAGPAAAPVAMTPKQAARELAARLQEQLFAPRVDLSQADLRSLDGSPAVGSGRAALKMRDVLDELAPGRH